MIPRPPPTMSTYTPTFPLENWAGGTNPMIIAATDAQNPTTHRSVSAGAR